MRGVALTALLLAACQPTQPPADVPTESNAGVLLEGGVQDCSCEEEGGGVPNTLLLPLLLLTGVLRRRRP